MKDIIFAVIAGAVQGVTEFLPISSSGHLVVLHTFIPAEFSSTLSFDVMLHMGTLAALLVFFWKDAIGLIRAWVSSFTNWQLRTNPEQRLAWQLFIATIPAAVIGYLYENVIEELFRTATVVAGMLILFGIILYLVDRFSKKTLQLEQLTFIKSIVIGCAQVLALVPGVSRAGITIIAGLSQNLNRVSATRFSFLLAMPIIAGAGVKQIVDMIEMQSLGMEFSVLIAGFISSAVVGYASIAFLLEYVRKHSMGVFAAYRIIFGFGLIYILSLTIG